MKNTIRILRYPKTCSRCFCELLPAMNVLELRTLRQVRFYCQPCAGAMQSRVPHPTEWVARCLECWAALKMGD